LFGSQSLVLFLVLVALFLFFSALRPDAFPTIANVMNMATNASVLLVLGVGSTFVILTGGIDLSINGVLVFSGVIAAMGMVAVGGDNPAVLLVGVRNGLGCSQWFSRSQGKDSAADRDLGNDGHVAWGLPLINPRCGYFGCA
jgi:ribose transport system permease protein